jgi:hypothetical protein
VIYNNKSPWPTLQNSQQGIALTRFDVDNHFGEYWKQLSIGEIVSNQALAIHAFTVYPNPSTGVFTLKGLKGDSPDFEIYNLQGKLVQRGTTTSGQASIDLSGNENGMYLIRSGADYGKVMLMK